MEGETRRLIASTSDGLKGGPPPGGRSWPRAARWPWSARRPSPSGARSRHPAHRRRGSSSRPRRRPGRPPASRSARPPSRPARARPAPGPRRTAAAAPRPACATPSSAAGAWARARLRRRVGRAPPGPRPPRSPRPSSTSSQFPNRKSVSQRTVGRGTPDGAEVALVLRHVIRAIRRRWPKVDVLVRGDSHYGRPEAMSWCERNRVAYVFGLAGNKVLLRRVAGLAEEVALERVEGGAGKVRRFGEFAYAAATWHVERRVIARVEASDKGADSRFVVTNLAGTPRWLYEVVYCARGRAENLVKAHKRHLASDRTSCTKATANQFRLVLHTAAYWLLHTLRALAPRRSFWRAAQLDTIRLALIKVAARVTELASRIELALPSDHPHRDSLTLLASRAARPP